MFNKRTRKVVGKRDKWTCQDCGRQWKDGWMMQIHHIKPKSAGGSNHVHNGVCLCIECHAERHVRLGEEALARGDKKQANNNFGAARMTRKRNKRNWFGK